MLNYDVSEQPAAFQFQTKAGTVQSKETIASQKRIFHPPVAPTYSSNRQRSLK